MPTITIDMDKKCKKCGEDGALPNGYCLPCFTKHELPGILNRLKRERNEQNKH